MFLMFNRSTDKTKYRLQVYNMVNKSKNKVILNIRSQHTGQQGVSCS